MDRIYVKYYLMITILYKHVLNVDVIDSLLFVRSVFDLLMPF